jgi:hypothetical protein
MHARVRACAYTDIAAHTVPYMLLRCMPLRRSVLHAALCVFVQRPHRCGELDPPGDHRWSHAAELPLALYSVFHHFGPIVDIQTRQTQALKGQARL